MDPSRVYMLKASSHLQLHVLQIAGTSDAYSFWWFCFNKMVEKGKFAPLWITHNPNLFMNDRIIMETVSILSWVQLRNSYNRWIIMKILLFTLEHHHHNLFRSNCKPCDYWSGMIWENYSVEIIVVKIVYKICYVFDKIYALLRFFCYIFGICYANL